MTERNKNIVRRTFRIHGLFFYNYRVKNFFLSQNELFCYLKKKYNEKDILFGYKGGDIESKLCKEMKKSGIIHQRKHLIFLKKIVI